MQISKNMWIEGIENQQQLQEWLEQQDKNMPNEIILKNFKWFLMQLEEDVKNNTYNGQHCNVIDKYAIKVIDKKIMKEDMVIRFIREAQNLC